ncbi:MAG: hypothetical protein K2F77_07490 [Muribaculaceae bacterium]|nr:hypothetical protein [Muribaculaceae bacterium]
MNTQENQFEALRQQWQSMKIDNDRLQATNLRLSQQLAAQRAGTRQQKLADHYRIIGIAAMLLLPFLSIALYDILDTPVWICTLYGVIGVIMGALNLWLSYYVTRTDYILMPTCEAIDHAARVLKYQSRLRIAGSSMAAVVLVPMLLHFNHIGGLGLLGAAGIGLAVGVCIGLSVYYRNRRIARAMLDDLHTQDI